MAEQALSEKTQTALNYYNKPKVRAHYKALADYGHKKLEVALSKLNKEKSPENDGLQARVSSRTKDFQSLCENIKLESGERSFENWKSIRDTYQDLAGVRLTLYIPGEKSRKKADELIKDIWPKATVSRPYTTNQETKNKEKQTEKPKVDGSSNEAPNHGDRTKDDKHEDNKSYDYKSTRAGYQAVHYIIKRDLSEKCSYAYESGDQFEIQVVSALLHGWAEAQHDVQYKIMAYGEPSNAEQRILDAINGILLSGDLLLEQFYQTFYSRVYQRFNEVDELGRFLRDSDLSQDHDLFPAQCQTHLFELLRKYDKNTPMAVRECIQQLGDPDKIHLDVLTANIIPKTWIGFVALVQRLEATSSANLDYNGYDTPFKQGIAIITTVLLLEDISDTNNFPDRILFPHMDSPTQEADVVNSLTNILGSPWDFGTGNERTVKPLKLKKEVSPAWDWFKSMAKNTNCFPGLAFRLVIRQVVPSVAIDVALKRVLRLHADVVAHAKWRDDAKAMNSGT